MTKQIHLHVGAPKSGSTYLQLQLENNREALAAAGTLVVGETHLDRIHAAMVVREDPRLAELGDRARSAWSRVVEQVRSWEGGNAVLSYELFAGASAEQARVALHDLAGLEVHVVVTARDFARAVPSAWQERLKFGLTTPLEEWRPRPESAGPRAEWGWRTMDPTGVAARWGADLPPNQVHVVTVPRSGASPDELWRRFAEACGVDAPGLTLVNEQVNESMGVVATELLRRVNKHVGPPIDTNREQAIWLRDLLAHGVLAKLDSERIGVTEAQFEEAATRSAAAIDTITAAGYAVHGDLEDVRALPVDARTPGQATDAELVDAAAQTIARLLLVTRERSARPSDEAEVPTSGNRPVRAVKRAVRGVASTVLRTETRRLAERVHALEAELQSQRALQLRVAELTDLVAELLVPADGGQVPASALREYREDTL